jgi:hypothetical protein
MGISTNCNCIPVPRRFILNSTPFSSIPDSIQGFPDSPFPLLKIAVDVVYQSDQYDVSILKGFDTIVLAFCHFLILNLILMFIGNSIHFNLVIVWRLYINV